MRKLISALLYTALTFVANTGHADVSAAQAMREGDMRKLNFHSAPMETTDVTFTGEDGQEMTLADFEGKYIVLNFWATWCAPCRKEMPHLSALQNTLGGDDFEVVTIATGRNPRPAMERFLAEIEVDNLPLHTDPRQTLARNIFFVCFAPRTRYLHHLQTSLAPQLWFYAAKTDSCLLFSGQRGRGGAAVVISFKWKAFGTLKPA